VEPSRFEIEAPIARHPRDRKRMAVVATGKEALSRVRVLRATDLATHVEVELATGRTHQIRVHLSHRGHPIVGDARYGGRRRALRHLPKWVEPTARRLLDSLSRPALHAARLSLRHPASGEVLEFASPLPDDIRAALAVAFPP
jgi:23S rRNA pseudouridine1911/1915/1917 synthase